MEKRIFKGGKEISLLGFGTMRLPKKNSETQAIDFKKGQEMVDEAVKKGVNYFDTAYMYHNGEAERFIGEALLKYPRSQYYLATKMPAWKIEKPEDLNRIFEEQLKKCQTDYFDFYLIHNINRETLKSVQKFDVYRFLKEKQKEGKIKHLGFSFHDEPELLEEMIQNYDWDFAQIQLNYLDWTMQNAKLQYEILTNRNIPIIVMEPVRGGSLATLSNEAADILKKEDPTASIASWAIRYAASLPNVLTVLSGMSDQIQLQDNLQTLSPLKPLSAAEYERIEKAKTVYQSALKIPCTYCRYCMECPSGVHIPKVFDKYNQSFARGDIDKKHFLFEYQQIGEKQQAHHCIKCGVCLEKCPQGIDIISEMEKVAAFAEKRE